jgi:hypothetical protein
VTFDGNLHIMLRVSRNVRYTCPIGTQDYRLRHVVVVVVAVVAAAAVLQLQLQVGQEAQAVIAALERTSLR